MIENINTNSPMNVGRAQRMNYAMSDDQKVAATEIISRFDPKNMTADDEKNMREQLRAEGIRPGEDLKNLLTEAGFKVAPPERDRQSPPSMTMSNELQNTINGFAEKFREGSATNDDLNNLLEMLYQNGLSSQGNLFDGVS
jgi:hypothetical protein